MNLFQPIEKHSKQHPEKTAVIFGNRRITYAELVHGVDKAAQLFSGMGLKKGDRVALLMRNSPEMLFCFYAAIKLGLINISLNIMLQKDELDYILGDCVPKILVAHPAFLPRVKTLAGVETGRIGLVGVEAIGNADSFELIPPADWTVAHGDQFCATADLDAATEAVIGYTSGTTGFPKGAVHSHGNIRYHLDAIAEHLRLGPADTFLAVLPFFQLPAFLIHPGLALHVGATLVIMEKFESQAFLDWIDKEDVTFFAGVPTIYQMLYDAAQDRRQLLEKVRFGICAGAPLSMKLRQNFESRMGLRIVHCYGSSETPLIAAFEHPEKKAKDVSVGTVAPHMRLRLIGAEGVVAAAGEPGEIQLGAENTLKYYWNNPEATDDAIRDGWFCTGDIGRFDKNDHLHIIDRAKDMIIRGGLNIYPAEIERMLLKVPEIREAVVVGMPDERLGEVPKAYVVIEKNAHLTAADIVALSREKLAAFKVPAAVEIVGADFFPRNAMGKIQKNALVSVLNEHKPKRGYYEN